MNPEPGSPTQLRSDMAQHDTHLRLGSIALDPLGPADAEGLLAAADTPETFRYFTSPPDPWTTDGMRGYIAQLTGNPTINPFAVRLDGALVGSTTYCDIRPQHLGVEIGWTWYAPAARATAVNPACKRLLLEHAFSGALFGKPAIRVCLKTDARNARSRAAISKLGAKPEGILRHHVIMPDGHLRDSAMYSITPDEWPALRDHLDQRLARTPD